MEIHRSYYYYESVKDDTEVEESIRAAAEYGDGFEKIFQRLRHDGYTWNHKKVYRVYKKIHFNKRSRLKKRLPKRVKEPLEAPLEQEQDVVDGLRERQDGKRPDLQGPEHTG